MHSVLLQFENPEYNYFTSVSDQTTKESAAAYFVGTSFNLGNDENENFQKCEKISFYPDDIKKHVFKKLVLSYKGDTTMRFTCTVNKNDYAFYYNMKTKLIYCNCSTYDTAQNIREVLKEVNKHLNND